LVCLKKTKLTNNVGHGISISDPQDEARVEKLLQSDFMKVPSEDSLHQIVKEFIERTGNDAMKSYICAVCAQDKEASKMMIVSVDSIPNPTLLTPASPHPQHDIFNGTLLEPRGLNVQKTEAYICTECHRDLERNKTPPLALANNMWIGRIPECLATLTLVERLLIAKYFPTAYIVKLYPKQAGAAHWDRTQLYSGFKGCVSTYALDPKLVTPMVDGNILPAPPAILSATVAVTFITPSGREEYSLPKILYARRHRIRQALLWLKANNPIYRDIIISEERLQQIPENDVPTEIKSTARHSTAIDSVIREHEGYVPSDASDEKIG
jgi:DNA-directed RNA polymerase subunit RPC12/RpoP